MEFITKAYGFSEKIACPAEGLDLLVNNESNTHLKSFSSLTKKTIIDLHFHSSFSDGYLLPEELLVRAIAAQIEFLALTDHDTLEGVALLHAANKSLQTKVINGVELSVSWGKYDLHILGYNFSLENPDILSLLAKQKENRVNRAKQIANNLERFGIKDAFTKASKYAKHGNIGRPHFAKVMVDEKLVKNLPAAFDFYLGENKKAYVKSNWIEMSFAIKTIKNAGGDVVLAHPLKYKFTNTKLRKLISEFKLAKGDGLEVVSADSQESDINKLAQLCKEFELLASSGSDFHGDNISRVGLGLQKQLPEICVPIWNKWS